MRVLVTGANGFVGRAIVAELLMKNFDVFCLSSPQNKNAGDLPNSFQADISDFPSLDNLDELTNIDVVIHSAGLAHQFGKVKAEDFKKINVIGTKNVALLALKLKAKHFVLIGSVAVYGKIRKARGQIAVNEEFQCEPEGIYAKSKLESEKIAKEICEKNQMPLTILRLATVIGENDRGNTARLVRLIDKGRFVWLGKGENYKSLVYKNDAARACVSVLDKKTKQTEIFNVTAEPVLMKEIVSEIAQNLEKKIPKIYVPKTFLNKIPGFNKKLFPIKKLRKLSETVEKWLSDETFSGEKIALEYGFRAETPISEAIQRQVEIYKRNKDQK